MRKKSKTLTYTPIAKNSMPNEPKKLTMDQLARMVPVIEDGRALEFKTQDEANVKREELKARFPTAPFWVCLEGSNWSVRTVPGVYLGAGGAQLTAAAKSTPTPTTSAEKKAAMIDAGLLKPGMPGYSKPDPYIETKLDRIDEAAGFQTYLPYREIRAARDRLRPILVQIYQDGHKEGVEDAIAHGAEDEESEPFADPHDLD